MLNKTKSKYISRCHVFSLSIAKLLLECVSVRGGVKVEGGGLWNQHRPFSTFHANLTPPPADPHLHVYSAAHNSGAPGRPAPAVRTERSLFGLQMSLRGQAAPSAGSLLLGARRGGRVTEFIPVCQKGASRGSVRLSGLGRFRGVRVIWRPASCCGFRESPANKGEGGARPGEGGNR